MDEAAILEQGVAIKIKNDGVVNYKKEIGAKSTVKVVDDCDSNNNEQ